MYKRFKEKQSEEELKNHDKELYRLPTIFNIYQGQLTKENQRETTKSLV